MGGRVHDAAVSVGFLSDDMAAKMAAFDRENRPEWRIIGGNDKKIGKNARFFGRRDSRAMPDMGLFSGRARQDATVIRAILAAMPQLPRCTTLKLSLRQSMKSAKSVVFYCAISRARLFCYFWP